MEQELRKVKMSPKLRKTSFFAQNEKLQKRPGRLGLKIAKVLQSVRKTLYPNFVNVISQL